MVFGLGKNKGDNEKLDNSAVAKDFVSRPEKIDEIHGSYLIVFDSANMNPNFDNLNKVINLMARKGWRCINICVLETGVSGIKGDIMYALMERMIPK